MHDPSPNDNSKPKINTIAITLAHCYEHPTCFHALQQPHS